MSCVNENCKEDPYRSESMVIATADGDLACSPHCLEEFKKQRDEFLNNIGDDAYMERWWKQ